MLVIQNIICVYSFDMLFTFVYTEWEGNANDSRVFLDAITRENNQFLWPREGEHNTYAHLLCYLCYGI